jgi:probable F420-dependent oxidoreductase
MPGPDDSDIPDPLIWLSYVAAQTTTIRLATGILILPQRNPVVLAKEVATLDRLSGGRVELGIGVGWLEEEFTAIGLPFEDRGRRTDDHVHALRALWSGSPATYDGEFVSFTDVYSKPAPTQASIPIVVGGHSKAAARRAGRLGDGFFPGKGTTEELSELFAVMRQSALDNDRDPEAIELTVGGYAAVGAGALDEVKRMQDLGVDRLMLMPLAWDPEGQKVAFARYHDEVISKV